MTAVDGYLGTWSAERVRRALVRRSLTLVRRLDPRQARRLRASLARRVQVETLLGEFSRVVDAPFRGEVLVDGTWDNPNHWVRYALIRRALGLAGACEVGVVGPHRVPECTQTFQRFGVREIIRIDSIRQAQRQCRQEALALLAKTQAPQDILAWRLPYEFPTGFFYDGLLKRQRTACVDLADPKLPHFVTEGLESLRAAEWFLGRREFRLVLLSHVVNFQYAALAWLAIRHGIPVVVLYGEFGVCRFVKLGCPEDLCRATNRPSRVEFESLPAHRAEALAVAGSAYLARRRAGETRELAAILAYQERREMVDRYVICERFGWDPGRPIIAVYASNWFDLPHMYGMSHFRDFMDWLEATASAAVTNRAVNWLFKAHPCDRWYGGITLRDLMPVTSQPHLRLVPDEWNGSTLIDAVDGLVTHHGTAGIEFAALGKPVLLADCGWYHELGIAKWPRSREEYLQELETEWWKGLDITETTRRARILAGLHFCRPTWQGGFVLEDDPVQDPIYEGIPQLWTKNNEDAIARELEGIRVWFCSSHRHYHTFKMGLTDEFVF